MLSVILLILKIIGIILLSVLALILFTVLLVFFVPIRYRGTLHYHGDLTAAGRISWLLHIISMRVSYEEGELKKVIRIFGIRYRKRKIKPKKEKVSAPQALKETVEKQTTEEELFPEEWEYAEGQSKACESAEEQPEACETTEEQTEKEQKESFLSKLKRFVKMLYNFFSNIRYTIRKICDNIISMGQKVEHYSQLLQDEHNQAVLRLLFGQTGALLRHVKPRKMQINLEIGTEDPAATGSILAVLGILYPVFEGGLHVTPHFDEAVFETDVDMKGRITVFVFLRAAWKIYFDKDVKHLLKILKNGEVA